MDSVGQDEICKVEFSNNFKTPKHDICKTGDYKEPDYIEADNESHDNSSHGIFCVTGEGSDCVDIDSIFDAKLVI